MHAGDSEFRRYSGDIQNSGYSEFRRYSEATSSVCVWKGVSLESVLVLARVPYQLLDCSCLEVARQAGGLEVLTEATKNQ